MKKLLAIILTGCLMCGALVGCGTKTSGRFNEEAYNKAISTLTTDVQELRPEAKFKNSSYQFMEEYGTPQTSASFQDDIFLITGSIRDADGVYTSVYVSKNNPENNEGMQEAFEYWLDKLNLQSPYTYDAAAEKGTLDIDNYQITIYDDFLDDDDFKISCRINFKRNDE